MWLCVRGAVCFGWVSWLLPGLAVVRHLLRVPTGVIPRFPAEASTCWITLVFDPRCGTSNRFDKLSIYKDASKRSRVLELGGASSEWPTRPVVVPGHTCSLVFEVGCEASVCEAG